jgi:LAO/AO transport system kinase
VSIDITALAQKLTSGDRRALARAITLVESTRRDHREAAEKLIEAIARRSATSMRIGISGAPGVGKSTFIEAFGQFAIERGRRLAVLAVDPSSRISGGSILGDKTRMSELSRRREAFIRPSPAGETLGGVARRTRESILLCEAAGFDLVIVETVGVGQSETAVAEMTDMFVLLLAPAGGDELQGVKRGVMELADLVIVNKNDGDLAPAAMRTRAEYAHALRLLAPIHKAWSSEALTCSALKGEGIEAVWQATEGFRIQLTKSGELQSRRRDQARNWLRQEVSDNLMEAVRSDPDMAAALSKAERQVATGKALPVRAARQALERFLGRRAE